MIHGMPREANSLMPVPSAARPSRTARRILFSFMDRSKLLSHDGVFQSRLVAPAQCRSERIAFFGQNYNSNHFHHATGERDVSDCLFGCLSPLPCVEELTVTVRRRVEHQGVVAEPHPGLRT